MDYQQLIDTMTPEIYRNLKRSVERGKWPDGKPLTRSQREHTLQAIIIWGQTHLAANERIGFIDKGRKAGEACDEPQETLLTWKD